MRKYKPNRKTIGEYLQLLDEPHKSLALGYTSTETASMYVYDLPTAISGAFQWVSTKEGHEYWEWYHSLLITKELNKQSHE